MPRHNSVVKNKSSIGAVDLHFHGAFGIDLMTATSAEMDRLSARLGRHGIAGFCPTTLSAPPRELAGAVGRMGAWIRSGTAPGAKPLGIHLEGPFVSPGACGAHPPSAIRPLRMGELEALWETSRQTLKILTIAPETLSPALLRKLAGWCRARKIVLSLGHSRATEAQAAAAFSRGFSGVTHAWNALPFHHRAPGPLGAALGRKGVHVEVILDQVHVATAVLAWTLAAHPEGVCFVSDCVPAAATRPGTWHAFGNLKVRFEGDACRVAGGHLAGGGRLLPDAYRRWLRTEARRSGRPMGRLLRETLPCLTTNPLRAIGLTPADLIS